MTRASTKRIQPGEVLYGVHPVIECLKAGKRKLLSVYMTKPEPKGWARIRPHISKRTKPNIQYVTRDILTRLAGSPDHMGIVAYVQRFSYSSKPLTAKTAPRILLLDGIQDVGNLGAILRTAYCTKVDAVVVTRKGCAGMTAAVFKASAGLAEHLPIHQVASLPHALKELKGMGYTMYMTVASGGQCATQTVFDSPMCMIIGSEDRGIDASARAQGVQVTLPQRDTSSYNASVAAGIFLFLTAFSQKVPNK